MVSPRKTTDVENLNRSSHVSSNVHGIKSINVPKQSSVPFGDVSNLVKSSRKLAQKLSEAAKPNKEQEFTKCEPKSICVPVASVQEVWDPIWNAPLAFGGDVEDTYSDIIPLSLQLTTDDISRLIFNKPRLPSNKAIEFDFEFDLPLPDSERIDEEFDWAHCVEFENDLPSVPLACVTFSDHWCDDDY